jgi:single-strand DNA-binding protein
MALNKVIILATLCDDVDKRAMANNTTVALFNVAINDKNKNNKNITTYVNVKCFASLADVASKYLSKGKSAIIEGKLKLDKWQDKTSGQPRQQLYISADNIIFIPNNKNNTPDDNTINEYQENNTHYRSFDDDPII